MNAFDKDYVKTYMPEFLTTLRTESKQYANGVVSGGKSRASRESVHGKKVNSIFVFPKTKARVSLELTEFHVYSKAGMPKKNEKESSTKHTGRDSSTGRFKSVKRVAG